MTVSSNFLVEVFSLSTDLPLDPLEISCFG